MNKNDILKMFCAIAVDLVETAEKEENRKLTKDDGATLSFEIGGEKYTVCITKEEGAKNE